MTRRRPLDGEMPDRRRDMLGRWILVTLVVSLVLHGIGWNLTRRVSVQSMSDSFYEQIVPRTFHVERVDIDPRLLEPVPQAAASAPPIEPIRLPDEKISPFEATGTPSKDAALPSLDGAFAGEKPAIPDSVATPASTNLLERADEALREELLREMSEAFPATPALPLANELPGSGAVRAVGKAASAPGFSNLDELLESTGPLGADTAPIMLPGDVLFEYDAYELQPGAVASLEKLARILSRNPRARFVIEGHSDSFGPPDYNMRLSELRAESVKTWLTARMGIDADRIQTRGLGQTRHIVPATESVEGQRLNRRVEIVIQNNAQ